MEVDGRPQDSLQPKILSTLETMTKSVKETRKAIRDLLEKRDTESLDVDQGISLLSLKHQTMIYYIHALTLLSAQRLLPSGSTSMQKRTPPAQSFLDPSREARGADAGDLIDSLVEGRVVLEKTKVLESRMRYQIEKLVRLAQREDVGEDEVDDPLSFRPNPANMLGNEDEGKERKKRPEKNNKAASEDEEGEEEQGDGIYRPPRIAPMPYLDGDPSSSSRRQPRTRAPAALSSLANHSAQPDAPHLESTSGLGGAGRKAHQSTGLESSTRARELARMEEYEESNMTRLVLGKKEAKRRRMDEASVALGGTGMSLGRRGGLQAGLLEEFGDLVRDRKKRSKGDGYDLLRERAKKSSAFERSKRRGGEDGDAVMDEGERPRKKTRFDQEVKRAKKRK